MNSLMTHPSRLIKYIDYRIANKVGARRFRRIARFAIGAIPTFGLLWFIGILAHNLIFEEPVYLVGYVITYSFLIFFLLTVLSFAFEFCWVHRGFILYDYVVSLCVQYQTKTGLGEYLVPLRIASLTIGILLLCEFIRNNCWHDFMEKQRRVK